MIVNSPLLFLNLWNPHLGLSIPLIVLTAFLLGMVHGITPDEHTWPITFSYAIGAYSTRKGFIIGILFSLAFTVQRAIASEIAYLALARWLENPRVDSVVYIIVGIAMFLAGRYVKSTGKVFHIHGIKTHRHGFEDNRALPARWALIHGFIAGWGFGAFALIIYTVLAPSMHNPWLAWLPGAFFGLGTMVVQAAAGALFGSWLRRLNMPEHVARHVAQATAGNTLFWGGLAFMIAGITSLVYPKLWRIGIATPLKIHNLHTLGIGFIMVVITVFFVGIGSLIQAMNKAKQWLKP